MQITTNNPVILPATTFDLVAIKSLQISWQNLNADARANYVLQLYSTDEYGHNTQAPTAPIVDGIPTLFATAASRSAAGKPALQNAIDAVLAALQEIENENGNL